MYFSFWTDFSRIRIFPDRIQSFGRWIRTQEKKLIWIRKKTRMRNTALIPLFPFFYLTKNSIALLTLIRVAYQPLRYQRRGLLEVFVQLLWYPPPPNTSPARLISATPLVLFLYKTEGTKGGALEKKKPLQRPSFYMVFCYFRIENEVILKFL